MSWAGPLQDIPEDESAQYTLLIPPLLTGRFVSLEDLFSNEDGLLWSVDLTFRVGGNVGVSAPSGQEVHEVGTVKNMTEYHVHKSSGKNLSLQFDIPDEMEGDRLSVSFNSPIIHGRTPQGFIYEYFTGNTFDEPWSNITPIPDDFKRGLASGGTFRQTEYDDESITSSPGIPLGDVVNIAFFKNNGIQMYFNYSGGQNTIYHRYSFIEPTPAKDVWVKYLPVIEHWEQNNRFYENGEGEYGVQLLLYLGAAESVFLSEEGEYATSGIVIDLTRISKWFYKEEVSRDVLQQDPQVSRECYITENNEIVMRPWFIYDESRAGIPPEHPGGEVYSPRPTNRVVKGAPGIAGDELVSHCALIVSVHSNLLCAPLGHTGSATDRQPVKITSDTLALGPSFAGRKATKITGGVLFTADQNTRLFKYEYAHAHLLGHTIETQNFQWGPRGLHFFNGRIYVSSKDFWSAGSATYIVNAETLALELTINGVRYNSFADIDGSLYAVQGGHLYELNPVTLGIKKLTYFSASLINLEAGPGGFLLCVYREPSEDATIAKISPDPFSVSSITDSSCDTQAGGILCTTFCYGPDSTKDMFLYAVDGTIVKKFNYENLNLVSSYDCEGTAPLLSCQFQAGYVYVTSRRQTIVGGYSYWTVWKINPDDMSCVAAMNHYRYQDLH